MPPTPNLPIEDHQGSLRDSNQHQHRGHHHHPNRGESTSINTHRSKLTSSQGDDIPFNAARDSAMSNMMTAREEEDCGPSASVDADIDSNQHLHDYDAASLGHRQQEEEGGRSLSHNATISDSIMHHSGGNSYYSPPLSISSTSPPPDSLSSPDNEAPLSMSDSSSLPSVSPPITEEQSQPSPLPSHPRPTAPRLSRVSSDPVNPSTPHNFAPSIPSGNRPAGIALPSHMHHHQSRQPSSSTSSMSIPQAGPSSHTAPRSTRYLDPDSHWLSEDEGELFIDDLEHNRQSPRRRGGPRLHSNYPPNHFDGGGNNDDDTGHDDGRGGKNSGLLANPDGGVGENHKRRSRLVHEHQQQEELFIDSSVAVSPATPAVAMPPSEVQSATSNDHQQQKNHNQQTHHHHHIADARRSPTPSAQAASQTKRDIEANATYRDYAPFIKDISAITPSLLKALTCPSCHKLMTDPTTLACGHSECLTCVAPKAASVLLRKTSPTSAPIAITAAVLTTEEGNRFQDSDAPPSPSVELDEAAAISGAMPTPRSPRAALADGVCPVSTCKKVTKATSHGRQGLRVDVVLQKIAFLLKNRMASFEELDLQKLDLAQEDRTRSVHAPSLLARRSPPSSILDAVESEDDDDQEGEGESLSEPLFRSSHSPSPRPLRSRSYRRHHSPPAINTAFSSSNSALDNSNNSRDSGPSNTSSPDEETKSEDNAKRSMKSKTHSKAGRSIKKSRGSRTSPSHSTSLQQQQQLQKHQAGLPIFVADVLSELECHICVTLIYEPLTTPCGHTFCKKCLLRSLDHSNRCPACRSELPRMNFFISSPLNLTLSNMLITTFPVLYEQRQILSKQEETESGLDTAIFVCMVSFPSMPTNLHIYEPKYRLMMRRALDTNKRFGMVLPSRQPGSGGYSQYGTMLEIRNMHTFEDGRSMVETVGVSRFKILQSGTMDGYTVAQTERIEDIGDEEEAELERSALERFHTRTQNERNAASPSQTSVGNGEKAGSASTISTEAPPAASVSSTRPATGLRRFSLTRNRSASSASASNMRNSASPSPSAPASPSPSASPQSVDPAAGIASGNPNDASASDSMELTNAQLVDVCKGFVEALRTGSTPWLLQRLNSSLPPMPEDPREFTWWMAMLMPIDDHEKARLLQITSYRLRLRLLVFWIQQMQHSWWFNRGCTIC